MKTVQICSKEKFKKKDHKLVGFHKLATLLRKKLVINFLHSIFLEIVFIIKTQSVKIHLIREKELNPYRFLKVVRLLQKVSGPIEFSTLEEVEGKDDLPPFSTQSNKVENWDDLLSPCQQFRKQYFINESDYVIRLVSQSNFSNWFLGFPLHSDRNDFFVHADGWDMFLESEQSYPIAFHVAIIPIGKLMFGKNYIKGLEYFHLKPRACAMDFCSDKRDVVFKLKSADFCSECIRLIKERKIPALVFQQVSNILENIRIEMLSKQKYRIDRQPSQLKITSDRIPKIILTDFNDLELPFSPLEKTVFLTFLKYPNGLTINEFCEKKTEITHLYHKLSNTDNLIIIRDRIENLTNPLSNSLSEKISKIKHKLVAELDEELAKFYFIEGPNAGKKKIDLDRRLILHC